MDELIFLGTGHALTYRCYTTSISLTDGQSHFIIDGGGGNGILLQLDQAGITPDDITDVFLTHLHTDHILGAVWLARVVGHTFEGGRTVPLTFYGHASVLEGFRTICDVILPTRLLAHFDEAIRFQAVRDGETRTILGRDITFFDIGAQKKLQYGFSAELLNGEVLVFLGDEPLYPAGEPYAKKATHLIHEALCLETEAHIYHPHRISHSTVRDAAEKAQALGVPHLILFHGEDRHMDHRKAWYTTEAKQYFDGIVDVPDDLDRIPLKMEVLQS